MSYGNDYSKKIYAKTKKYQKIYGFKIGEENMDKWNNAIGREIANEIREESRYRLIRRENLDNLIAEKVIQRLRKGELITHPSDPRKYRTPAQKFSDEIKAKYHQMQEERKRWYPINFGKGHWVTIDGNHVFIED